MTVEFEEGVPVALDGERLGLVELIERAAELGMRHGVGIVDHIEDRIVGLKVRDIYEVPAAAILLTAHKELERLCGTIHQNQFKPALDQKWAYLVYAGLWWEPLREDIDAYAEHVNKRVSGTIGLKLYKGGVRVVTRASRRTPSTTRSSRRSRTPAGSSPSRPRRASSRSGRCSRAWPGVCASASRGRLQAWPTSFSACSRGRARKWFLHRKYGAARVPKPLLAGGLLLLLAFLAAGVATRARSDS